MSLKEYQKQYRDTHKEESKLYRKKYSQEHKKEISDRMKKWYLLNKIRLSKLKKELYLKNKEILKKRCKDYVLKNRNKRLKTLENYRKNHQKEIKEYNKHYNKTHRININLRRRIHKALKGICKSKHTVELLGCSVEKLKQHLESKFIKRMTWQNYGYYGWHVDHIKPCASFDLSKVSEQRKCFHYTNLQPLWAKDNLSKGGR